LEFLYGRSGRAQRTGILGLRKAAICRTRTPLYTYIYSECRTSPFCSLRRTLRAPRCGGRETFTGISNEGKANDVSIAHRTLRAWPSEALRANSSGPTTKALPITFSRVLARLAPVGPGDRLSAHWQRSCRFSVRFLAKTGHGHEALTLGHEQLPFWVAQSVYHFLYLVL